MITTDSEIALFAAELVIETLRQNPTGQGYEWDHAAKRLIATAFALGAVWYRDQLVVGGANEMGSSSGGVE